jgi:hypothetical protein
MASFSSDQTPPSTSRSPLFVQPQVTIQTIMQFLDLSDKLILASQCKFLRAAATADGIAWIGSAAVPLPNGRILSPAFSTSVFRFAPLQVSDMNWCIPVPIPDPSGIKGDWIIPDPSAIEVALTRVKQILEVRLGKGLGTSESGNVERRRHLRPQELFWRCVRAMPALQTLEKLVVCSSLAPADMCAQLCHLSALHTLHIDAGYDRTCYPPQQSFSLIGVDQLPMLTDLSYPEPQGSLLFLARQFRRSICIPFSIEVRVTFPLSLLCCIRAAAEFPAQYSAQRFHFQQWQ